MPGSACGTPSRLSPPSSGSSAGHPGALPARGLRPTDALILGGGLRNATFGLPSSASCSLATSSSPIKARPFMAAVELSLPSRSRLLAQPLWASIGWAVPAALGASLAAPERRVIVIAGDGALQQTASELSKLLTLDKAPVVVLINNDGYTIERAIHRPAAV